MDTQEEACFQYFHSPKKQSKTKTTRQDSYSDLEIQGSLRFWIPRRGFRISQVLDPGYSVSGT